MTLIFASFLASRNYYWINNINFDLYSSLYLGSVFYFQNNNKPIVFPTGHLNLIGILLDQILFIEFGLGNNGAINLGFK